MHIYIQQLQLFWKTHVKRVLDASEKTMWRLFSSVRTETRVCQSAVLRAVRPMVDPLLVSRWPTDRRALDRMIDKLGGFNSRIMRDVHIDMKDVGLDVVKFTFVDPIYAWAATALRVSRCWPPVLSIVRSEYSRTIVWYKRSVWRSYGKIVCSCSVKAGVRCDTQTWTSAFWYKLGWRSSI